MYCMAFKIEIYLKIKHLNLRKTLKVRTLNLTAIPKCKS